MELNPSFSSSFSKRVVARCEVIVAAALAVAAIRMHLTVLLCAGGLWRDEANTVNLAQSGSLLEMFEKMAFDSSGLSWLLAVRGWSSIGLRGDFDLRILGFIIGMAIFCALIWSARKLGVRIPILAVGLFCLNPNALVFGDSLRSYGCATVFLLLTAGFVFELTSNVTCKKAFAAFCASLIGVHSAFPNIALVAAIYAGGLVIALRERHWKQVKALIGLAFVTFSTVVVYYPTSIRVSEWIMLKRQELDWLDILKGFGVALGFSRSFPWPSIIAASLPLIAIAAAVWILVRRKCCKLDSCSKIAVLVLTASGCALLGQFTYLKFLSYQPYPWHYLPFFGLLCLLADAGSHMLIKRVGILGLARLGVIILYGLLILPFTINGAQARRTNIDLIASKVGALADRNDLIVVHPFFYGISFSRYYTGSTPWTTLPQIEDHSLHRWDLIKEKMKEVDPEKAVIRRVQSTLRNGHRVWIVGNLGMASKPESQLLRLPPAPHSSIGWNEKVYEGVWSVILGRVIQEEAAGLQIVPLDLEGPINVVENVDFVVAQGRS